MLFSITAAQDSVDVIFRYSPSGGPAIVHVPGEFNNWANNSSGNINPGAGWTMAKQPDGSWIKTIRLKVNGGSGPDGSYQYKFNEGGSSSGWLPDPLNPRTYGSNSNSIIHVRRPTIFHLKPLNGSVVGTATPELIAEVFPVTSQLIDTGASSILVDGMTTMTFGGAYDASTGFLRLNLPTLSDGEHTVTIVAAEARDYTTRDSTRFTVRAAALQWLTRDNPRLLHGDVTLDLIATVSGISDVIIVRNGVDTAITAVNGNVYSASMTLQEGDNNFIAFATHDGLPISTTGLNLYRVIDHTPVAVMQMGASSGSINLNAVASTDPDGDDLQFHWRSEDDKNPSALAIDQDGAILSFPVPTAPGEYYFRLEARDPDSNTGIARNYIRISSTGDEPVFGTLNENPGWVRDAVVYEIFVPAFSSNGNLQGVIDGIPHMKLLGVNTLWLMPIMDNPGNINSFNGGYSIIDFYNVDESLGTNADFDRLVDSCHANKMKLILDMTPNHVAGSHPWVNDIRKWREYSIYRPFIENRILGGDRGLGQSVVTESGYALYARFSNWTLANLNLSNAETRDAMMDVYRYWLVDRNVDGFRLDVYWGPQERYGANTWWRPFREEIKRYKPDVFLLGETDGTGGGSEINYADGGGGLDAGYDWNWYGQIKSTLGNGDIAALNSRTTNYSPNDRYNHYTGPNAHYFRFLENHDEDRIAQVFQSNAERTKPGAAVMLTAPGIPMLYAGQEIGWKGRRDRISFSNPPQPTFLPYYRKLIMLRETYSSLRSPRISQILHGTPGTYAYLRPGVDENIIVAANFRDIPVSITMAIPQDKLDLIQALQPGKTYYLNDLSVDSTFSISPEGLSDFAFSLAPFQSRILLFSDTAMFSLVTGIDGMSARMARSFSIDQVYPNPARSGGSTNIRFTLGTTSGGSCEVRMALFDGLGRLVLRTPMLELTTGTHTQPLDLASLPPGQYMLYLQARAPRTGIQWSGSSGVTILH
jgi:glycosidase